MPKNWNPDAQQRAFKTKTMAQIHAKIIPNVGGETVKLYHYQSSKVQFNPQLVIKI